MANITQINVNGTTYDIKDATAGDVTHDDSASAGSAVPINADQLGGYTVNTLLKLIYPVGSVYLNINNVNPSTFITGTTWELISSVALASEHVFGNGKNLGLTDNTKDFSVGANGYTMVLTNKFGSNINTAGSNNIITTNWNSLGVPTKTRLGNNLDYSGLISDTITLYTWKRTA